MQEYDIWRLKIYSYQIPVITHNSKYPKILWLKGRNYGRLTGFNITSVKKSEVKREAALRMSPFFACRLELIFGLESILIHFPNDDRRNG